jgi:lipoyl(octanoyl) transferase
MIEWHTSTTLIDYSEAVQTMQARVKAIQDNTLPEWVWFLEHPPLYTCGTSGDEKNEVYDIGNTPLYKTGRGGKITYHGPGQRIAYVMLDLNKRTRDIRAYVRNLEEWIIRTLAQLNVKAERRAGRVGLWVKTTTSEDKIAAIGVRLQKWVSFHGIALNIDPDLTYFNRIIPCGIQGYGVTSLKQLGIQTTLNEVDLILKQQFKEIFDHEYP